MARIQKIVLCLWCFAIVSICTCAAFAQTDASQVDYGNQLQQLQQLFGWPGLVAGAVVVALGLWRKMYPKAWDKWPRWIRFGLGFLASGGAAGIASIVSGSPLAAGIVQGAIVGLGAIGLVEGTKTAVAPKAKKGMSATVAIPGPDGTGIGSSVPKKNQPP